MNIIFNEETNKNDDVLKEVESFLNEVKTLEAGLEGQPIIIYQDGKSKGYYIKCGILSETVNPLLDMNAKLDPAGKDSFRANRELMLEHNTFKRMVSDAKEGREFNDIIIEYTKEYSPDKPMKIWGGQHRAKAIQEAYRENKISRYHGFRIFFKLSKQQRTEIALISNTNITVSNDLFDRLQEETLFGLKLRKWCYEVGLLKEGDDFPDQGSKTERLTVKLARTFIVNFYNGKERSKTVKDVDLDKNIYEPYLCESGAMLDPGYERITNEQGDYGDKELIKAGKAFAALHKAQHIAVKEGKGRITNSKSFRNKAITESVISSWSYVAGLLQGDSSRLKNHYSIPKTNKAIPDPLNAREMSIFHHDSDEATYRGLGTRSAIKDRQRMAQLFLARSMEKDRIIDKNIMNKSVSQVVGIKALQKGYTT